MEHEIAKISKLKGTSNWAIWKFQVSITLKASGSWDVITEDVVKPERGTEESEVTFLKRLKEWRKLDSIGQKIIATTVEDEVSLHIINCETTKDMWNKLVSIFERKSEANLHILQQQWFAIIKDKKDNMSMHISKIQDLAYRLKIMGEEISESMIMTKLIMTLPPAYKHFISAWDSTHKDERTLDNLISRLSIEETRTEPSREGAAFAVRRKYNGSTKYRSGEKINRKQDECYNCHKIGHWARDCLKKKDTENQQSSKKDKGDALIVELLTATVDSGYECDKWYLDSDATDHMSNNFKWFRNYKKFEIPMQVRIGDGKGILALGSGEINILAFDGKRWNKKFLEKVLYVPEIKFNLFSLGTALDKGLTQKSDNEKCYLYKNKNCVAMGVREDRLFRMKFRINFIEDQMKNTTQAQVSTAISISSLQDWHKKMGHQNLEQTRKILKKAKINYKDQSFFCRDCPIGKIHFSIAISKRRIESRKSRTNNSC